LTARGVLVTGAAGFIGGHLVRRLVADGYRVIAVDARNGAATAGAGVEWHRLDIRDTDALGRLVAEADTVVHLASVHLDVHAAEREFDAVNVRAASDLVRACSAAGVRRLIHTSTVGVYGHVEAPPADESAPCRPQSVYERTKFAGEQAVLAAARASGLDLIVLRPSWVYGPGCMRTARLLRSVRKGRFVFIGDGFNLRHPVHVSDMIDAYILAMRAAGSGEPKVYNVAGPEVLSLREMVGVAASVQDAPRPRVRIPRSAGWMLGAAAEVIFRFVPGDPPISRRTLAFFGNDNAFSTAAARRDLGFRPSVSFEDGLRRTLAEPVR
jgi:nucleoside-diphosphate-sugar epimerase